MAVHGLGGDAYGTWTDDGKLWLRDFLPKRLESARIFTYGYDSVVAFSKSSAEVDDFARDLLQRIKAVRASPSDQRRPLYFICHSLGGLVVKQVGPVPSSTRCCSQREAAPLTKAQALGITHKDKEGVPTSRHLLESVSGVVFMGTPHSGADIAFWASLASRLFSFASLGTRTNKGLVKLLRKDSNFLGGLSLRFAVENPRLHILSFYELEKFPLLNCRVSHGFPHLLPLDGAGLTPADRRQRLKPCRPGERVSPSRPGRSPSYVPLQRRCVAEIPCRRGRHCRPRLGSEDVES